ncbi:MAG: oligosaccharide flippase family protein [Chitinophagaceae bacterium]
MVSLKKNLLYNFLLSVSQVAFPLISIPYISRVLDPEGIGRVSFIDSFTYYFIALAEFGIVVYGIRETSRKKNDLPALHKLVSELVSLHIITSCISLFIYSIVVFFLYQKINDPRLILFSVSFLLANFFASEWYFWGKERFKYIAIRSVITRALGLISIFLLINTPEDYLIYYAIIVVTSILNITWNAIILFKEVNISFRKINWRQHIKYTRITYKISLLYGIVTVLDVVFLRMVSTVVAVAYYAFAAKIVRISGALVTDMLLVFFPRTVALLHEKEEVKLQQTILHASELILLASIPMATGLYLLADTLTLAYFGAAFLPVAVNLKILCIYPLIKSYSLFINKQLLLAFDMEKLVLKGLLTGAVVFIVSTLILSYLYADNGTSFAIIISELTVLLANIYYVKKINKYIVFFNLKTFLQAVTASLLFIPVVYFLENKIDNVIIRIVVQIISCILIYFFFLAGVLNNRFLNKIIGSLIPFSSKHKL